MDLDLSGKRARKLIDDYQLTDEEIQQIVASARINLATFDPEKKTYRMWTYTAQGAVIEWKGKWDATAKRFTWTAPLTGELDGTLNWKFANPQKPEIELQVRLGPFTAFTSSTILAPKK